MLKANNNAGSRALIKPDRKKIEFEVDEHDVPYLMEHRTIAGPASIDPMLCLRLLLLVSPLLTLKHVKADPGSQKMIGRDVIED